MEIKRKTIENDEEYLRQVSLPVDFQNDDYKKYIEVLEKYCKENVVFALAPVQIGIPKRLIYIKNTSENMEKNYSSEYDENIVYINPTIISMKGHTEFLCKFKENDKFVYYACVVDRPYQIELEYFDI